MLFRSAPPEDTLEWSDSGVEGAHRFLKRLWSFCSKNETSIQVLQANLPAINWSEEDAELRQARSELYQLLQQATHDYQRMQFNTVASAGMKMLKVLERVAQHQPSTPKSNAKVRTMNEGVGILLRIIYPVVPHISSKLWKNLGFEEKFGNIIDAPWPTTDEAALKREILEIVVQVNGKLRGRVTVPADAAEERVRELALAHEDVQRHVAGKDIKKMIVVPGKLVNIVVSG